MGRFISNRNDVKSQIEDGGWRCAYGRELTVQDAVEGAVAAGVSIYTGSPEVVLAWLDNLVNESLIQMETNIAMTFTADARQAVEQFAWEVIANLVQGQNLGERFKELGQWHFKAGLTQFMGQNQEWNPVANVGNILDGGDAGEWVDLGPPIPSLCPYVGLQTPVNVQPQPMPPIVPSYFIVNRYTGKYLDLAEINGNPDGADVRGWSFNGQPNQRWSFEQASEARYRVKNVWSGKYLDNAIVHGNPNGANIYIWQPNGQANQVWIREGVGDGDFRLRNDLTAKYMDMALVQGNPDGAEVYGWALNGQANQIWRLIPVEN